MTRAMQSTIEDVVRTILAPVNVERVDVEQGHDHSDEAALFVTITLPHGSSRLPGTKVLGVMTAVSDALLDVGEQRFPYVRLNHAGEEYAEEASRSETPV